MTSPIRNDIGRSRTGRVRQILFLVLDGIFLMVVGATSLLAMHWAHDFGWPFPVEALLGMAAAMAVQVTLALLVAPLLGSIESMVPSMVVAMLAPMALCGLHLLEVEPSRAACAGLGALLGLLASGMIDWYGVAFRRRLARRTVRGRRT